MTSNFEAYWQNLDPDASPRVMSAAGRISNEISNETESDGLAALYLALKERRAPAPRPDDAKPQFGDPIGPWHRKFAWLPTGTFDCGVKWLRFLWRRRVQKKSYLSGPDHWWQYRTLPPKEH